MTGLLVAPFRVKKRFWYLFGCLASNGPQLEFSRNFIRYWAEKRWLEVSHPSEFALTSNQPAIKCLKCIILLPSKKDNTVYLSIFNPLKVKANSKHKVHNEFRGANSIGWETGNIPKNI